jgi:hypothetical protein
MMRLSATADQRRDAQRKARSRAEDGAILAEVSGIMSPHVSTFRATGKL